MLLDGLGDPPFDEDFLHLVIEEVLPVAGKEHGLRDLPGPEARHGELMGHLAVGLVLGPGKLLRGEFHRHGDLVPFAFNFEHRFFGHGARLYAPRFLGALSHGDSRKDNSKWRKPRRRSAPKRA